MTIKSLRYDFNLGVCCSRSGFPNIALSRNQKKSNKYANQSKITQNKSANVIYLNKFSQKRRFQTLITNVSSNTLQGTKEPDEAILKPQQSWQKIFQNPQIFLQQIIENPEKFQNYIFEKFGLTPRIRGLILLNILTLLMASNWVVVKESELGFDPFMFAMLRFGVASAALLPFLKTNPKNNNQNQINNKKIWLAGTELGLYSTIGYMTQAIGLLETDASRASLISTFTVILVPVFAGLSGRGVKPLTWGAGVAALVGVSMLEGGGGHPPNMGDFWSVISAIGFALQVFRTEIISRGECGKHVMQLLAITVFITFVFSGGIVTLMHPQSVIDALQCMYNTCMHACHAGGEYLGGGGRGKIPDFQGVFQNCPSKEIIYTGLLTTDAVLLIEMFALADVSSVEAALIYTMEPVLGAALAYWFLGERWGPLGWVGAALILTSSLAAQIFGENLSENDNENHGDEQKSVSKEQCKEF